MLKQQDMTETARVVCHLLMRWGHKQTSGPSALRKSGMSLSEKCLLIYG